LPRHRDDSLIPDIIDKIDFEPGDVLDMPRLLQDDQKARRHACGAPRRRSSVRFSAANPALSIQVNVLGLVNVLEAARALDCPARLFTSAKGVYGPITGEYGSPTWKPMPEDLPAKPSASTTPPSSWAKTSAPITTTTWASRRCRLRFASTYGPGKTARHGPMALMSRIVEKSCKRPAVSSWTGRRGQGRLHLQQGFRARHLPRNRRGQSEEPRVQHRPPVVGVTLRDFERVIKKHIPNAPDGRSAAG